MGINIRRMYGYTITLIRTKQGELMKISYLDGNYFTEIKLEVEFVRWDSDSNVFFKSDEKLPFKHWGDNLYSASPSLGEIKIEAD
jgi:tricorn protease-like protein